MTPARQPTAAEQQAALAASAMFWAKQTLLDGEHIRTMHPFVHRGRIAWLAEIFHKEVRA